jgi:hypothetical protein
MLKPPRFTLRFLLVALTIVAIGFGVWKIGFQRRQLTESDAATVKLGMGQWRVRCLLGPPHYTSTMSRGAWGYELNDSVTYLNVTFTNGKVAKIERQIGLPDFETVDYFDP